MSLPFDSRLAVTAAEFLNAQIADKAQEIVEINTAIAQYVGPINRAYYASNIAQTLNVGDIINFNVREVDTDNAVTTGAAWKFTCPRAGTYLVTASIDSSVQATFELFLNGVYYKKTKLGGALTNAIVLDLAAGDFIDFRHEDPSGSVPLTGDARETWIQIVRLVDS